MRVNKISVSQKRQHLIQMLRGTETLFKSLKRIMETLLIFFLQDNNIRSVVHFDVLINLKE